jgi:hypothetical protein
MRAKIIQGALVLAIAVALAPSLARAQGPGPDFYPTFGSDYPRDGISRPVPTSGGDASPTAGGEFARFIARGQNPGAAGYAPADPQIPLPLGSTRPEDGGLFLFGEYVMYHQTNTISSQQVATRGFIAVDGTPFGVTSGTYIGSGAKALDTGQLIGPRTYVPGFELGAGWKFKDGSCLTFTFMYLFQEKYDAAATLAPKGLIVGDNFAESFITAPVFQFPNNFAGPLNKAGIGTGTAVFGVWNGASIMTEQFVQRFEHYDLSYRMPVYDTECYRLSGILGGRIDWIWDRYRWTSFDLDPLTNSSGPGDIAIYNNIVSNRLYGGKIACSQEYYMGHGLACMCDIGCCLFMDSAKTIVSYELGAKFDGPKNKRATLSWRVVPECEGTLGLMWYPTEFIQLQIGYNVMAFFNTLSSMHPIDFDYSALTPHFDTTPRLFDGWKAGIAFIF